MRESWKLVGGKERERERGRQTEREIGKVGKR